MRRNIRRLRVDPEEDGARFAAPQPPVLSLVTGEASYNDLNARELLQADGAGRVALDILPPGDPRLPALVVLAATLPNLLLGPIAGTFVDRWDQKHVMIVSDLIRAFGWILLLRETGVIETRLLIGASLALNVRTQ